MSYFSKRALRWAAPVALVGALGLAACGDNDDTEAVRVAAPSVAGLGSDQHLANQAEELARASASAGSDQHLNNAADEIARAQRANEAASARLAGEAERQAHLDGNAETYGNLSADAAAGLTEEQAAAQAGANTSTAKAYGDEQRQPNTGAGPNTAGNRAALAAQADAYVESLEARADSGQAESAVKSYGYVAPRVDDAAGLPPEHPAYPQQLQDRAKSNGLVYGER